MVTCTKQQGKQSSWAMGNHEHFCLEVLGMMNREKKISRNKYLYAFIQMWIVDNIVADIAVVYYSLLNIIFCVRYGTAINRNRLCRVFILYILFDMLVTCM